jgi:Flp pilus assembly protein CpaB
MRSALRHLGYRLGGWPRRVLALSCLLLAAASALTDRASGRPAPERTQAVVVAAHDLSAGQLLGSTDITVTQWPAALRPAGAFATVQAVAGRRLGGPIQAREAVTATRLVGAGLAAGLGSELVATTITLSDHSAADLVRAGDLVDLYVGSDGAQNSTAALLAESVRVLAVLRPAADDGSTPVVVAVDRSAALKIAGANGRLLLATVRGSP